MDVVPIYLLAPAVAWLVAQSTKALLARKDARRGQQRFFRSGGMPSVHSATMVALTTVVGVADGFYNALFAVTAVVTVVVMYDAIHVRRAVGEQGRVLSKLTNESFFSADGHRLSEVLVGSVIGFAVAIVLLQIL